MAWRYREIEIEDGDVLDPKDWNENVEVYSNEINGFLDRDNLNEGQIALDAEVSWNKDEGPFYAVEYVKVPDLLRTNPYTSLPQTDPAYWQQDLEQGTQTWQQVENVELSIPTTSDELFIIEGGLRLQHDLYKKSDHYSLKDNVSLYMNQHLGVSAIITVDGYQVAEAGPIAATFSHITIPLMGVLPVSAGSHDVKMFVKLERRAMGLSAKWSDCTELFIDERNLMVLRRMR